MSRAAGDDPALLAMHARIDYLWAQRVANGDAQHGADVRWMVVEGVLAEWIVKCETPIVERRAERLAAADLDAPRQPRKKQRPAPPPPNMIILSERVRQRHAAAAAREAARAARTEEA